MSSTRRKAEDDATIHQGRYMSSPEFVEARGINGPAMAARVELLDSERKRGLILFLQALSLEQGGTVKLAHDIIDAFPDRIGTPTMHRLGMEGNRHYSADEVFKIRRELDEYSADSARAAMRRAMGIGSPEDELAAPWQEVHAECYEAAKDRLPGFLVELSINPALQFDAPGEKSNPVAEAKRVKLMRGDLEAEDGWRFKRAEVPYFKDIIGALFDFQRRYVEAARRQFVETSISRLVFRSLNAWLELGKIVVIEGDSRIGKTTAAEAWCRMHLGKVRFVKLNGFANKTTTLRKIARALGVGSTHCHSPKDMEPRIFDVLSKTGIMLVIDEAHFLFTQGQRIYSRPEMIDWFDTELFNNGIPVALVTTPQFVKCMALAERQVGWNCDQFKGRVGDWKLLPPTATKQDLYAVAKSKLPHSADRCVNLVVGYALTSKRYMSALVDVIDRARYITHAAGRDVVEFADVNSAIQEYVMPSERAKERVVELKPRRRSGQSADLAGWRERFRPAGGGDSAPNESDEPAPGVRPGPLVRGGSASLPRSASRNMVQEVDLAEA